MVGVVAPEAVLEEDGEMDFPLDSLGVVLLRVTARRKRSLSAIVYDLVADSSIDGCYRAADASIAK